jgi:hypothetical protein
MVSWLAFTQQEPQMSATGKSLLYQHGVGLAFLATIRPDGRPRVHQMCPLISDDGLLAFIVPSPKQRDLKRSGAYALHSFPCPDNEDAFDVTGQAALVSDRDRREALARQFVAETPCSNLISSRAPSSRTTGHGDPAPDHRVWHAG